MKIVNKKIKKLNDINLKEPILELYKCNINYLFLNENDYLSQIYLTDTYIENLYLNNKNINIIEIKNVKIKNLFIDSHSIKSKFNDKNSSIVDCIIKNTGKNILEISNSFIGISIKNLKIQLDTELDISSSFIKNDSINSIKIIDTNRLETFDSFKYMSCNIIEINNVKNIRIIKGSFCLGNIAVRIDCKIHALHYKKKINGKTHFILNNRVIGNIVIDEVIYDLDYIKMLNNYIDRDIKICDIDTLKNECNNEILYKYNNKRNKIKLLGIEDGEEIGYNTVGEKQVKNYNYIYNIYRTLKNYNHKNSLNKKAIIEFGNLKINNNKLISILNYLAIFGKQTSDINDNSLLNLDVINIENIELKVCFYTKINLNGVDRLYIIIYKNKYFNIDKINNLYSMMHVKEVYALYNIGDTIIEDNYLYIEKHEKMIENYFIGLIKVKLDNKIIDLVCGRVYEFKEDRFGIKTIEKIYDLNNNTYIEN